MQVNLLISHSDPTSDWAISGSSLMKVAAAGRQAGREGGKIDDAIQFCLIYLLMRGGVYTKEKHDLNLER